MIPGKTSPMLHGGPVGMDMAMPKPPTTGSVSVGQIFEGLDSARDKVELLLRQVREVNADLATMIAGGPSLKEKVEDQDATLTGAFNNMTLLHKYLNILAEEVLTLKSRLYY